MLSYEDETDVYEKEVIRNPSFKYEKGYITVKDFSGEVVIYRLDGSVFIMGTFRDGDRIPVEKGVYIIKVKGATFKVIAN